jgi:hypothetical protein
MKLTAIAAILESAGVAEQGKTLFINFIPQNLTGILLRDYFGGSPRDHELPGYIKAPFMLIGRGPDYQTTYDLVVEAVAALEQAGKDQVEEEGIKLNYARGRTLPFPYSSSQGQNWEVTVTVDCCYVDVE